MYRLLVVLGLVLVFAPIAGASVDVEALLARMTLREKVGQMTQLTVDALCRDVKGGTKVLDEAKLAKALADDGVGSVLNTVGDRPRSVAGWRDLVGRIQAVATTRTRLRIPVLYGVDSIHGATYVTEATLFPQQIGLAASWNVDLAREMARITAYETRAAGIPWNFSPVLGLGRDPRWPRQWETFGEDPYLVSELGKATIEGYQGDDPGDGYRVAACMKHFLGYSFPLSGKDRTPAWIPERQLREYFVPPFRVAARAGCLTAMICSGEMNGIPVHTDRAVLTDLLKKELGLPGFAVSDWADIEYLHNRHRVAATMRDAVEMAVLAGVDMSMTPNDTAFADHLVALVEAGRVPVALVDEAVRRILTVKAKLGLFEAPMGLPVERFDAVGGALHERVARRAAVESMTLLKNDGDVLPLKPGVRLLVAGPNADSMRTLNGGWSYSWQGEKADDFAAKHDTILEALRRKAGPARVTWVPGVRYRPDGGADGDEVVSLDAVTQAAASCDCIVLCLGENSYTETPGNLNDLTLSERQLRLADTAIVTGRPVILVLNEGRPRLLGNAAVGATAILQTYLPGNSGGTAVADVLFGDAEPTGRLPYSYPRHPHGLGPYTAKGTEVEVGGCRCEPLYPFGHGLGYTTFAYEDLRLRATTLGPDGRLEVSLKLKNTGKRRGTDVVQLYVRDRFATVTPDDRRLRRFEKVTLDAGDERRVFFELTARDLAFIGRDCKPVVEPGDFDVLVGGLQASFRFVAAGPVTPHEPVSPWRLVWSDEFDGTGAPESTRWVYETRGNESGWGNRELQWYRGGGTENAFVADGLLHVVARREALHGKHYSSARLSTRGKGDWKYGRLEIRAKLPAGRGTWPAIWMLSTDDKYRGWPQSGEIDIMEHVGHNPGSIHASIHTKSFNHIQRTQKTAVTDVCDCSTAFHVYALEWDERAVKVFVDDRHYFTFENPGTGPDAWPFDERFHLILNVAVGGSWGGQKGVDDGCFPQTMLVDYVRVYAPAHARRNDRGDER